MISGLLAVSIFLFLFVSFAFLKNTKKLSRLQLELAQSQTKEKTLYQDLSELQNKLQSAIKDPATDLIGWQVFEDRLSQSIKEGARYQLMLGVLFVDLNSFKVVNDALGFEKGNLVLKEIANRIQSCIRQVDSLARYNKDIFIVLLRQINKAEAAAIIAQRILQAIAQPILVQQEIYVTASIGIAVYPTDGVSVGEILYAGDQALHIAKTAGKHNYHFYRAQTHEQSQRELTLVTAFKKNVITEDCALYFQPIFNVQTETIFAMDTIIHWQNSEFGLIKSNELLELAEKQNASNQISEWMLAEACKQFLEWRAVGFAPQYLAMPITMKQLSNSQFVYRLSQIMQEMHFDPQNLLLEIKENKSAFSLDIIEKTFNMLEYLKVKLAIDQFGASTFNLRHLKNLRVHYLKLEPSFIDDIGHNPRTKVLVDALVQLTKQLQAELIVVGVNTPEQVQLIKNAGCFLQQGDGLQKEVQQQKVVKEMGISVQE